MGHEVHGKNFQEFQHRGPLRPRSDDLLGKFCEERLLSTIDSGIDSLQFGFNPGGGALL